MSLSPDMTYVSMDSHMSGLSDILNDPKSIFIVHRAFGGNASQIEKVDFSKIPEELKNEPVIVEYKKQRDRSLELYKEFGAQYIHKTKPINGKFERKDPPKTSFPVAPSSSEEETEDSLHRWRLLQEERGKSNKDSLNNAQSPLFGNALWGNKITKAGQ